MNGYRNAHLNRVTISGTFKFLQMKGASKATHLRVMRDMKARIRERDAEPAAWFTGPTRAEWVKARLDRGEKMTNSELGRALTGGAE